ncbi:MAG: T9SS type A sorting domain-containing protein [Candidatus Celaenobacter antarcticus]|nr:T9SS type A sorting domain-containing protein [Candidatus Celaenobacter antarcticus]MDP8315568.1 T9SS type A sorting domain-containing protein [Candidatus Celaenobacter antarcticus]
MKKLIAVIFTLSFVFITSTLFSEQVLVEIWNPGDEVHDGAIWIGSLQVLEDEVWESGVTSYYFPIENPPEGVWAYGNQNGFYPGQVYYVSAYDYTQCNPNTEEWYVTLELTTTDGYDEFRTTNLSSEGWNWVSFPVMDPDYSDPIQHVLTPILNDLEEVRYKNFYIRETTPGNWTNTIGDFRSIDGYKIKMKNTADLEVAGWWKNPTTVIPLYEGQQNWLGYFLQESLSIRDAFDSIWDYWTSIKSKHWAVCRQSSEPTPHTRGTVNPGELYIVTVSQDCGLVWGTGEPKPPYKKPETEYFTYTETSEYEPIIIDTVYGASPEEIGIFIGGECIGGSKIEDGYPVFVPAYITDDTTRYEVNEITFGLYNGIRNELTQVKGVKVYDPIISAYVDKPIYLNKDDFKVVRLNTEEAPKIPIEFSLHQNYPNPIRTSTTISFSTPELTDNAEIMIYNVKGQLVKTLLPTTTHQSALTNVYWNGTDENGNQLSNGIYFYKLKSGEKTAFKKMILLR